MYHCNLFAGEKYYLYLFFTSVTDHKSFEDFKTIDHYLYPKFCATCVIRDLLEDNGE